MFDWLRGKRSGSQQTATELRTLFDAQMRHTPKTLALVRHARAIGEASHADLQKMAGGRKIRDYKQEETLSEKVNSAISCVSYSITLEAMEQNGISVFLPGFPFPREAPALVAFTILVTLSIKSIVENEGHSVSKDVHVRVSSNLFFMHDSNEAFDVVVKGSKAAEGCLNNEMENVKQWRDNLFDLATIYVLSLLKAEKAPTIKEVEKLYGSMLKVLLNAVE